MTEKTKPLTILELEILNIKRIIHVKIVPKSNIVEIAGQNEAGKTTALDCIQYLLEGKRSFKGAKILRNNQEKGYVKGVIGEEGKPLYTIQRIVTQKGDYLKLSAPPDAPKMTQQELLDSFYHDNALELGGFVEATPQEQIDMLLRCVTIPVNADKLKEISGGNVDTTTCSPIFAINFCYNSIYSKRGEINQDLTRAKKVFESIEIPEGMEDAKPVDIQALIQEKENLQEIAKENELARNSRDNLVADIETAYSNLGEMEEQLKHLQVNIEKQKKAIVNMEESLKEAEKDIKTIVEPDFTKVDATIANANKINETAIQVQKKKEANAEFNKCQKEYDRLTSILKQIKQYRVDALSKADFPLKGMSINEDGIVTFGGVAISKKTISTSRGIKIETALAKKQNPKLGAILIRRGNDLDDKNREVIEKFAQQTGYQIWIEKLRKEPDENCFYLKEGELIA